MTAGLHPKLPTIRRERGRQTGVALLTSKCASIGRPAAINVKSLKRHLVTEGPTDANACASLVCTYARWPITGELRKVPTVHILQREKSLEPRRLMLMPRVSAQWSASHTTTFTWQVLSSVSAWWRDRRDQPCHDGGSAAKAAELSSTSSPSFANASVIAGPSAAMMPRNL